MTTNESDNRERGVNRVLRGVPTSDGAGVRLTRVIGGASLSELDPFLLLDQFGSDRPGDYIAGFPEHPHRGFETVTYMLAGKMRHRDNQGNNGLLGPGSVQWMTAGRGIVHSEMPEQEDGLMQGFQLWLNLPAAQKMCEPRYQDIPASAVPVVRLENGVRVRVLAGQFADTRGPVQAEALDAFYWDVELPKEVEISVNLPQGHAVFAYVFEGEAQIGHSGVHAQMLAVLGDGDRVTLAAPAQAARLLLVGARPIGEPIVRHGPFVMNTHAEIHQAIEDYRAGRL